jgi:DNA helicase-2/ATP-dependent DNA helicase PcrA
MPAIQAPRAEFDDVPGGDKLNPAQRAAAGSADGPLLIIAGAGSGKTQTLAHRVATLIARGADPRRILLLTFSTPD